MSIDVNVQNDLVIVTESSEDITVNVSNAQGPAGVGVPIGGSTGQVLKKASATNYDTYWAVEGGGVPYSGATGDVDLGEYELKAGQIEFDQTPTGTAGVGVMRWNDSDGTVDLGLKGGNVTLQVGQEQVQRVVNKSGASLSESAYQVVKVTTAQGQRLAVDLAQGNNDANSTDTLGIVTETIANNQEGFITTSGLVRNINTTGSLQGETWADGDVLYLSATTAGAITKVKPTAPNHTVILGYVVYAHANNGKIFVKVDNGYEIGELHDVYVPNPSNNDGIFWNTANSRYQNNTIAGALGYTPVPTTRTLTINGTAYDLSADRSWTVSAAANTIYTADGTLTGNRVVTMGGNILTFLKSDNLTGGFVSFLANNLSAGTAIGWDGVYATGSNTNNDLGLFAKGTGSITSTFKVNFSNANLTFKDLTIQNNSINSSVTDFYINYFSSASGGSASFRNTIISNGKNGTIATFVGASGRLLLGTTTEGTYRLDVNGSGRISNDFYVGDSTTTYAGYKSIIIGASTGGSAIDFNLDGTRHTEFVTLSNEFYVFTKFGVVISFYPKNIANPIFTIDSTNLMIGTNTPVDSSILTLSSTNRGFLPPRMTTTQKNAISSPAAGLQVYDTTLNQMSYYNGTTWINF